MNTTTAAAFADAAHAINAARSAWQDDLRTLNAALRGGTATARDVDAILARSAELDTAVELLRRKFYPRAHRLIIGHGSAITISKTARSTKRVWTAPATCARYDE